MVGLEKLKKVGRKTHAKLNPATLSLPMYSTVIPRGNGILYPMHL